MHMILLTKGASDGIQAISALTKNIDFRSNLNGETSTHSSPAGCLSNKLCINFDAHYIWSLINRYSNIKNPFDEDAVGNVYDIDLTADVPSKDGIEL